MNLSNVSSRGGMEREKKNLYVNVTLTTLKSNIVKDNLWGGEGRGGGGYIPDI